MGYLEARYPSGRRVLAQDLVDRYDLHRTALARLLPSNPVLSLWLLLGDVDVDEVRLEEGGWADHGAAHNPNAPSIHGLFIIGDLRVHGAVHNLDAGGAQSLFVMGDVRATNIAVNGAELVVRGTTVVDEVICCSGPDGEIWFDGDVQARLVASDNCPVWVSGHLGAPVLETGQSRIGLLDPAGVREARPDVPAETVLFDEMRAGQGISFGALHSALLAGRPVLTPSFAAGGFDVEAVRRTRESRREAATAMADGRYLAAARLLRGALEDGEAGTRLDLAQALFHSHERAEDHAGLEEALRLLDSALGPRPQPELVAAHPTALLQRASILLQLDGFGIVDPDRGLDQAWADCAQVLTMLPPEYHAVAHHLMGRLLYVKRHYDQCYEYLERAVTLDGGLEDIHADIAKVLWMLDREADAVPHATLALAGPDVDDFVYYVRGKCLQRLEQWGSARSDLDEYHRRHPDDPFTTVSLMEIDLALGEVTSALQLARSAVDLAPTDLDAVVRFGRVLRERSLHEQAVPFLRHAVDLVPDDAGHVRDLAVSLLAVSTAVQDPHEDGDVATADVLALSTALRLLEISADTDHLRYLRGECYRILGDLPLAERDLSRYLDQHPDAAAGMASLARVYLITGRTEEARLAIRKALRGDPESEYIRHASRHLVRIEDVKLL